MLELLIALSIAAAALAVLFRGVSENLASLTVTDEYESAISRCKSHLAALGRSAALTPGENAGDDGDGYRWHLRVNPVATVIKRSVASGSAVAPQPAPVSLYHVRVGISWMQDGKEREVALNTMRLDQRGEP